MSKSISEFKPDDVVYVVKLGVQFPEFYKGVVQKVTAAQMQIKGNGSYIRPERPSVCSFHDNFPDARSEFIEKKLQVELSQHQKIIESIKCKIDDLQNSDELKDRYY